MGAAAIGGALVLGGRSARGATGHASAAAWTYDNPGSWGTLDPAYAPCAMGHNQSPIALGRAHRRQLPDLKLHYKPSTLKVQNLADKHTIEAEVEDENFITLDDRRFDLVQFHFHHPAEHTVMAHRAALECHLVHQTLQEQPPKQAVAVLAVLIDSGRERRKIYNDVLTHAPPQPGATPVTLETKLNPRTLLPSNLERYHYWGSLTTPPCSEGVSWNIFVQRVRLPARLIAAFATLYPHDNRPLQPLNGRRVSVD